MSDIQLLDRLDPGDGLHVLVREAMTSVYGEAHAGSMLRRTTEFVQAGVAGTPRMGVSAGVQFHCRDTKILGGVDRALIRINEERDMEARFVKTPDGGAKIRVAPGEVEPALGGDFLAPLRDNRHLVRLECARDRHDFVARSKFEVADRAHCRRDRRDVAILDVATVFAQVNGDAVGTCGFGFTRGRERVGLVGLPSFPHGGDMVNVDVQPKRSHSLPGVLRFANARQEDAVSLFAPRNIALFVLASAPVALPAQTIKAAASPAAAVQDFLRALADSNLKRMAELFGNAKGPVAKTKPKDYEKKIVIMQLMLHGVQSQTLGDVPGKDGMRAVTTILTSHGCKVTTAFNVVQAPQGWLVHDFDLDAAAKVNQPCDTSRRPGTSGQ